MTISREAFVVYKMTAYTTVEAINSLLERLADLTRVVMVEGSIEDGEDWLRVMSGEVGAIRDGLSDVELKLTQLQRALSQRAAVSARGDSEGSGR
jgi:hypothetical protein